TDLCKPAVSPVVCYFFFSSRRRHTRFSRDWSSDVCSSDLLDGQLVQALPAYREALAKFQRILRQRNRLLDRIGQGEGSAGSLEEIGRASCRGRVGESGVDGIVE